MIASKRNKKGQATIEYILLIALIATVTIKCVKHVREIFFGWEGEQGSIEVLLEKNIIQNLTSDGF